MSDYLGWVTSVAGRLSPDLPGTQIASGNYIKHICFPFGDMLYKEFSLERPYVPRVKILGEVAYSLFDYHMSPATSVSPRVYPISRSAIWREFLPGTTGEMWRGDLYFDYKNLDRADGVINELIQVSRSAERIALLDLIFMCQDRSARNWVVHQGFFYAVDNGMLWPYKGRFADKLTVETRSVKHLKKPMLALIPEDGIIKFKAGIFSALYAGLACSDDLLNCLYDFNWAEYFNDLRELAEYIYPANIVDDWRFQLVKNRVKWLIEESRFPTVEEAYLQWNSLVETKPSGGKDVWRIEWES